MLTNTVKATAKKVITLLASFALMLTLVPAYAFAAPDISVGVQEEMDLPARGMWGTCPWEIDEQGTLTVHPGEGANVERQPPWQDYEEKIETVVFAQENGKKVIAPASLEYLFHYDYNQVQHLNRVKSIDLSGLDTSRVTDMGSMFSGCSSLTSLDLSGFDTSRVTDMHYMFSGCSSLASLDLSSFDSSKVTVMVGMFSGCSSLSSLDLSNLDTSSAKAMNTMFSDCSSLLTLDLSNFNTSSLMAMGGMFMGCSSLLTLDLSSFDTSKVASDGMVWEGSLAIIYSPHGLSDLFKDCLNLSSVKLGSNFSFKGAEATVQTTLPDDGNWRSMNDGIVYSARQIADARSSIVDNPTDTYKRVSDPITDPSARGIWGSCPWNIDEAGTLTVHPGQGVDTREFFPGQFYEEASPWQGYEEIIKKVVFVEENEEKVIAPARMSHLFPTYRTGMGMHSGYANSIEQIDFHGLDTSQTTDMSDMFFGCSTITNLDLSGFDTSRVIDMSGMFSTWDRSGMWASLGDSSLVSLDLSGFDTSQVTDMREMFRGCGALKSVSLGNRFSFKGAKDEVQTTLPSYGYWRSASDACQAYTAQQIADTRNNITDLYERGVVPVSGMWGTCPWEIDAEGTLTVYPGEGEDTLRPGSGFDEKIKRVVFAQEDGRKVIAPSDSSSLLSYSQVDSIDLSGLDTSRVTNMSDMFGHCSSLPSIDLSGLDTSRVTNMSSMFSGCSSLSSLDLSGLDTSRATDMCYMFSDCSSLSSLSLSGLDTSNVKTMQYMFRNCSSLVSLDLSGFDTSSTTAMAYMFLGCSSLTSLDISGFDTSNAAPGSTWDGLNGMFGKCDKLSTVSLSEKFSFKGASDTVQTTLPEGEWRSTVDGKTYTVQQIAEERNNFADTYTRGDIPVVPTTPITAIGLDKTSFTYSASNPPKPKVTVKAGFAVLSEGADYDITWPRDLRNAGTKEVKVTAKGKYSGTLTASYEVVPAQLPIPMIDRDSFVYDGKEKRPAVTVTDGSTKLAEGTDYTVAWPADVTNVGEKVITVTSRGNYTGARTLTYRVEEPAVQPPSEPVITTGDGQSWKPGSAAGATFRSTAALADFLRVIVDDVVVDRANYDLSEGSTIVTLKPEYLAELVPGNHEIKIVSTTGTAKAPFVTEPAPDTPSEPSKPDEPNNPGITDPDVQLMYRLYNPNSGEHFYTASVEERDHLDSVGWDYEGHAWTAPKGSATPVYRLYSGTDHHYTTSAYERDELLKVGWSDEGVGWYSDDAKGIELHRLFNPNVDPNAARNNSGSHHYTTSDEERDHLVSIGWRYEDYGWYGVR